MRVLIPWTTDRQHARTREEAARWVPDAEWVNVEGSNTAYYELLDKTWRECAASGEDLVVIEHDMQIRGDLLTSFGRCTTSDWCGFEYPIDTRGDRVILALGCARFKNRLINKFPDAVGVAGTWPDGREAGWWFWMDGRLMLQLEKLGYKQHAHGPPLRHYHYEEPEPE